MGAGLRRSFDNDSRSTQHNAMAGKRDHNPRLISFARKMRKAPTDAEKKLWSLLRHGKLDGHHFRRQVPIDHVIVDFACFSARLVIELDGGQHNTNEGLRTDAARDAHLYHRGFNVLRFWNNDVMKNIEGVMHVIRGTLGLDRSDAVAYSQHQPPSP